LGEEAEGFGAMRGVVVEPSVEGAELFLRDQRQDGSSQKRQVFGSFGFAPHTAIFPPAGGVAPPVVLVFHRPVLATDLRQSGRCCLAFLKAEDEVAGFLFGFAAELLLMVAGEAGDLPRSGEEAAVRIKGGDAQFAVFDASVGALGVRDPGGGKVVEFLSGLRVEGGLVVFEGEVKIGPGGGDDQCRFFWVSRASPVTTALARTEAACLRSVWLTGSSQSFFSPL
jgi:hypothetical protein